MLDEGQDHIAKFDEAGRVQHVGLGLYGLTVPPKLLEKVFDRVVAFFAQLGCAPTEIASDVVNSTGKAVSYARGLNRWRARWMESQYFWLCSVPDDVTDYLKAQNAAANYKLGKDFIVTFCPARVGEHTEELLELAWEIADISAPCYGAIYRVAFGLGPIEYGIGLRTYAGQSISDWGFGVLRFGLYRYLRNTYRWNFLTDIQLNALVNGQRLEDWIKQGPRRGQLTPFVGAMTQWTVPEEDTSATRQILDEAGLFFDYERDIVANCRKYRCNEQEVAEYLRMGKEPRYNPPDPNEPALTIERILGELGVGEGDTVLRKGADGELHPVAPPKKRKRASDDKK